MTRRTSTWRACVLCAAATLFVGPVIRPAEAEPAATQAGQTTSAIPDSNLARRLEALYEKTRSITSLETEFEQRKKTPLLKKPVVTSGVVRVAGGRVLWQTRLPRESALLMADSQVRIYFPSEKRLEVYEIEERLAQLASSPLPQLPVLTQYFVMREASGPAEAGAIELELTPSDAALARHLRLVRVTLDAEAGTLRRLEVVDPDGGSTSTRFTGTRINPPGLTARDVSLTPAEGTRESYPLGRRAAAGGGHEP